MDAIQDQFKDTIENNPKLKECMDLSNKMQRQVKKLEYADNSEERLEILEAYYKISVEYIVLLTASMEATCNKNMGLVDKAIAKYNSMHEQNKDLIARLNRERQEHDEVIATLATAAVMDPEVVFDTLLEIAKDILKIEESGKPKLQLVKDRLN